MYRKYWEKAKCYVDFGSYDLIKKRKIENRKKKSIISARLIFGDMFDASVLCRKLMT